MMLFVQTKEGNDPAVNLATEEYLLKEIEIEEPLLLLYINRSSVIIGRNQNPFEEINEDFVTEHQIPVIRRISGGGTVYHDLGNLNYSLISNDDGHTLRNYLKFTEPIITALQEMGVPVSLNERNDLVIENRKVSGTAQFSYKGKILSHGTLLYDANLDDLRQTLQVKPKGITSKAIQSRRSHVVNIKPFLAESIGMDRFKVRLLQHLFKAKEDLPVFVLDEGAYQRIEEIAKNKYRTWEWNVGESPNFQLKNAKISDQVGKLEISVEVKRGLIDQIRVSGLENHKEEISNIKSLLQGVRYEKEAIKSKLEKEFFKGKCKSLSVEEMISLLFP